MDRLIYLYELGGPVLLILLSVSILTMTLVLYKVWQFLQASVGNHRGLRDALSQWDKGERSAAKTTLQSSSHFLGPVLELAMHADAESDVSSRFEAEAEQRLQPLESGFRVLDIIAQLAPLLGLLGTVLGMIEAFKALQDAGSQVDPADLAGGIWVALITTAAGLSVAMPTAIALNWLEARIDKERVFADYALSVLISPNHRAA